MSLFQRHPMRILLAALVASSLALPGVADGASTGTGLGRIDEAIERRERPVETETLRRVPAADEESGTVRLVVKATKSAGLAGLRSAGRSMGFKVRETIPHVGWTLIEVPAPAAEITARRLRSEGVVSVAERDVRTRPAAVVPDDPMFGAMWQLDNTGQSGGTPDADIDAPEAWERTTGSRGVVVAVCDTGVDITHEDLAGNIWVNPGEIPGNGIDDDGNGKIDDVHGWDWFNGDGTVSDPDDGDRHGTHVAGTIGAVGGNAVGITGISHDVSIMVLKHIGPVHGNLFDAAAAIVYAVDSGAGVINHSWTAAGTIGALDDAISYAGQHGVINVAAAGNNGTSNDELPYYPAAMDAPNVIAVAATDHDDMLPTDGYWAWSNWGSNVDLAAPGDRILSTVPGSYASSSGTSMASPHVTGVVALLKAAFPAAPMEEIRARVEETVDRRDVPFGLYGRVRTGGRLNAASALAPAFAAAPTVDAPAPGGTLEAGRPEEARWTPPPFTSAAAIHEVQLGFELQVYSEGFEDGASGWLTGGNALFTRTADPAYVHTGSWAIRSGVIGDDQWTYAGRSITVPSGGGVLEFWYMLDSEDGRDFAYMLLGSDLRQVWEMNRDRTWTRARVPVPEGTYDVWWVYQKDEATSEGLDALAIDDVRVTGWDWGETVTSPAGSTTAEFQVPRTIGDTAALRIRA
ncbi:MAG: S8 family serine peptidase, partial [Coriobacteriia bacterium]|nr:S8 family serine peptidase [Coriobacteriia bacterium]